MGNFNSGHTFKTGNSTVAQLPVGTVLTVSAQGELKVTEVPVAAVKPGDRFYSKHGPATVVQMTSRFDDVTDVVNGDQSGYLYVADGTNTVRVVLTD